MNTRQAKPIILTAPAFEDFRGYLAVPYDQSINFTVRQINQGYSKKAFTLRGMHFQEGEHAQAKLVSCLHGSIFNVAVDLRPGETYGHAYSAAHIGVRPHKERINISKEIINKTRGAVAPYAAQIFTHLSVVSSRQRSYDRLRCKEVTLGRGKG